MTSCFRGIFQSNLPHSLPRFILLTAVCWSTRGPTGCSDEWGPSMFGDEMLPRKGNSSTNCGVCWNQPNGNFSFSPRKSHFKYQIPLPFLRMMTGYASPKGVGTQVWCTFDSNQIDNWLGSLSPFLHSKPHARYCTLPSNARNIRVGWAQSLWKV